MCEGCNETLKKNKVDAHAARCYSCWAVTCVDCSIVFEGDTYRSHTSCISEAQKYQGALYKKSPAEKWAAALSDASSPDDTKVQSLLNDIKSYDNVPRKKSKFINFVKNSIDVDDDLVVIERAYDVIHSVFTTDEREKPSVKSTMNEEYKRIMKEKKSVSVKALKKAVFKKIEKNSENKRLLKKLCKIYNVNSDGNLILNVSST